MGTKAAPSSIYPRAGPKKECVVGEKGIEFCGPGRLLWESSGARTLGVCRVALTATNQTEHRSNSGMSSVPGINPVDDSVQEYPGNSKDEQKDQPCGRRHT